MTLPRHNEKGFTLVELMIVVAIIGILAAIAVPQFMAYRLRAYNAGAKAVCHNLKADEANLNSELGAYGHTEATAHELDDAANPGAGVADTNAVADLAIPSTADAAGARMFGGGNATLRGLAIPIALGRDMTAYAEEGGDSFIIIARHFRGDTAYGMDSDIENTLYTVSNPNWPNAAGLQAAAVTPSESADDFDGEDGDGAPTTHWTVAN